jgi:hypothetical protein
MGDEDDKPEATITAEWITPTWVSESLRDEAARLLPFYDRLSMTVSEQSMLRWLNVLWTALPKGRGMANDWDAVKVVYAAMLDDFPALCFSKRSMMAARDRFKWFPSTNELAEFLTPYRNEIHNAVYRLRVISKTTTERGTWTAAPERPPRTEAELRAVADICAAIRAGLDSAKPTPTAKAVQDPEAVKAAQRAYSMARPPAPETPAPAADPDERLAGMTTDPTTAEDP